MAIVQCGSCGIKREFEATPSSQIVDIYCKFTDTFYSKSKPAETKPVEQPEQAEQPEPATEQATQSTTSPSG
jgi:transcription elongation factor Elf1